MGPGDQAGGHQGRLRPAVIPAQAGTQGFPAEKRPMAAFSLWDAWVPACAGTTLFQKSYFCPGCGTSTVVVADPAPRAPMNSSGVPRSCGVVP